MDSFLVILCILAIDAFLIYRLRRSFMDGLACAVPMLICLPIFLKIELSESLPNLTVHRLILLTLFFFWLRRPSEEVQAGRGPFFTPFVIWSVVSGLSLLCTAISFGTSLKRFLEIILEYFLFYVIVAGSVRDEQDALRLLRSVWIGIVIVGLFAVVERYTGFDPVDRYIPGYVREEVTRHDVLSTYQHRILLGAGMAMGWPLALALISWQGLWPPGRKWWLWGSVLLLLSSCYFSMSRGPWIATGLVLAGVVLLSGGFLRQRLFAVMLAGAMVLVVRPGVYESIFGLASSTAEEGSLKEGTFKYRLELWKVAWSEITKGPLRTMIGYGPAAGTEIELQWSLSYRDKVFKIESWDNHFAYDLFQGGVLGLLASLVLYGKPVIMLLGRCRTATGWRKEVLVAIFCSMAALVFMMTNVLIFAKQLHFMFWALAVIGLKIGITYDVVADTKTTELLAGVETSFPQPMIGTETPEAIRSDIGEPLSGFKI